ncbi:DUF6318 family protein [Tersicoccus solisilvae]|nr:DUF6318 family protein [Tersicoccus solisilvae]
MPAAAKQKTEAGLLAYSKYWVDALSYAYETDDISPAQAATSRACVDCTALYDAFTKSVPKDGWGAGGKITSELQLVDRLVPDINGNYVVMARLTQQPYTVFDSVGVPKARNPNVARYSLLLYANFVNGRWGLMNYDRLEG